MILFCGPAVESAPVNVSEEGPRTRGTHPVKKLKCTKSIKIKKIIWVGSVPPNELSKKRILQPSNKKIVSLGTQKTV